MKIIKFKTEFTQDCSKFVSNAGNGKAVPQYELDENNKVVPVIDEKTGEQVVHNLYKDIQLNKNANNYKNMLESGVDPVMFASNTDSVVDTTQFGSGTDLLKADVEAQARGFKDFNSIVAAFQKFIEEKQKQEKQVSDVKKDTDEKKEVK